MSAPTEKHEGCPTCICGRRAPVQGEYRPHERAAGTVAWVEHEEAYTAYALAAAALLSAGGRDREGARVSGASLPEEARLDSGPRAHAPTRDFGQLCAPRTKIDVVQSSLHMQVNCTRSRVLRIGLPLLTPSLRFCPVMRAERVRVLRTIEKVCDRVMPHIPSAQVSRNETPAAVDGHRNPEAGVRQCDKKFQVGVHLRIRIAIRLVVFGFWSGHRVPPNVRVGPLPPVTGSISAATDNARWTA